MSFSQPAATAYDADLHCLRCTEKRFPNHEYIRILRWHEGEPGYPRDSEGNPVHVLLEGQDDEDLVGQACGDCGEPLCPSFPDCIEEHPACRALLRALLREQRRQQHQSQAWYIPQKGEGEAERDTPDET